MSEPSPPPLSPTRRPLGHLDELRLALNEILVDARREIVILSQALDPALYDQAACCDRLFDLIKRNHQSRIRVLISNLEAIRLKDHRLLNLAQQTPSFIEIRLQDTRYRSECREWLISDARSVLYREQAERSEGIFAPHDRHWALELYNQFEEMWQVAEQHPDLRRLTL